MIFVQRGKRGINALSFEEVNHLLLPLARVEREQRALRAAYSRGRPFPHLVLDGLFDPRVLDQILAEFPGERQRDWIRWDTRQERKQTSRGLEGLGAFTQWFCLQLCSEPWLRHLRQITGIEGLVADPMFFGGGLHESARGGWLNVHADYTKHPSLPLVRRLNLIVYLNHDWREAWGGGLELWDAATRKCSVTVAPHFNRAVLFPTTREALHGFPSPISCPRGRLRRSLSIFYWEPAQPESEGGGDDIHFLPAPAKAGLEALVRSVARPLVAPLRRAPGVGPLIEKGRAQWSAARRRNRRDA